MLSAHLAEGSRSVSLVQPSSGSTSARSHCAASRNSNSEAATAAAIELAGEKCASAACSSKPAICPKLEHGRISDLSNANE